MNGIILVPTDAPVSVNNGLGLVSGEIIGGENISIYSDATVVNLSGNTPSNSTVPDGGSAVLLCGIACLGLFAFGKFQS